MMEVGHLGGVNVNYRSNKLVVEGGKCNLIVQVAKMVFICKRLKM